MRKALLTGIAVAGAVAATTAAQARTPCIKKDDEAAAVKTHVLKTELMVAALTCRHKDRYNAFVERFENRLEARGQTLKAMFERAHDGDGRRALDRYVTRLANKAAARGTPCTKARALFSNVMTVPPQRLARFADSRAFSDTHGLDRCGTRTSMR